MLHECSRAAVRYRCNRTAAPSVEDAVVVYVMLTMRCSERAHFAQPWADVYFRAGYYSCVGVSVYP